MEIVFLGIIFLYYITVVLEQKTIKAFLFRQQNELMAFITCFLLSLKAQIYMYLYNKSGKE